MTNRTKYFFMDGLLTLSLMVMLGGAYLAIVAPEPLWKKSVFFLMSGPLIIFTGYKLYTHLIRDRYYSLVRGVYVELETFLDFETPQQAFFDEVMPVISTLGDVTFVTRKSQAEAKKVLSGLTTRRFEIIPLVRLTGKKVEVFVTKRHADAFDELGLGWHKCIRVSEKK